MIKKIGDEYFIEFFARGLKYQQKAGMDRAAAQALLDDIEAKIARGEAAMIVRDVDVDIFLADFCEYTQKRFPPKTARRFISLYEHFTSFLNSHAPSIAKLSSVTPQVVEQYKTFLAKTSAKPRVINLTLILLRYVFEYSRKLGYLNDNPTFHLQFLPHTTFRCQQDEPKINEILRTFPQEIQEVCRLILLTGLTRDEAIGLRWEDINLQERKVNIAHPARNALGESKLLPHEIPLDFDAVSFLEKLKGKKKRNERFVFAGLSEGCRGNVKESFYPALRNIFAKKIIEKHVTLLRLQEILGLDDIAKVLRYAPFDKDSVKGDLGWL